VAAAPLEFHPPPHHHHHLLLRPLLLLLLTVSFASWLCAFQDLPWLQAPLLLLVMVLVLL
jgi:hypothetical protein